MFLIFIPISVSRDWHLMVMSQVGITIIFAISFNQLLGQTGLLNLGHSIFMGAGSYFSGLILLKINNGDLYIPLIILPLLGGGAGFILAVIIGYFSVQRAGIIFAMLTLAILEFVNSFSISFPSVLGGMTVDRTLNTNFFNFDYSSKKSVCNIVMTWLFISLYVSYYFLQTPLGKMCNVVRENASRTEYIGYSVYMVRYLSFCFSGFIAGIAGTLFVINYELVSPEVFSLRESFNILSATFIGGTGYFLGPIVGACIFSLSGVVLSNSTEIWSLYQGIILMIFVLYFPRGLTGFFIDQRDFIKSKSKLGVLSYYLKTIVSALITIFSVAWLIECLNTILHHQEKAHFVFLWVLFSTSNPLNWFAAISLVGLGFYFLVSNIKIKKEHSV
ncbi:branched-chain amino acid ABC transporter permease [Paracoccaceae bacterium]|nr:branched-chain amino acid ABC transporter permease [Paracoccaceae bacterium]